ncbi:TRAP transporter small permease [Desulfobacula phenolica]|uniref:TRAP-type C4-dicarboxylate transport system, small permease component n=1 Tax=Desulfobacula phenolica TaxID=90732 RepID=A0A1H2E460_9BACT|nr:TRAP transporter small permease [Desulfobacula phenolica]SDT89976.1 TRAP-type C4-dicarboxylate transport system, small permease component [Desulfobacula phenolica]
MNIFSKGLDKFSGLLKIIGATSLTVMMLLTVVDVIGRFFKHPIFGSVELVGFLATIVVATALPYTYKVDGHVGVEILVRLMSKKKQIVLELVTRTLTFILFCLITWQMFLYAMDIHETGEVSMNLEFPIYYIVYLLAFGLLIFTVTIIESIFQNIKKLRELKIK